MRILHIITGLGQGGAEAMLLKLLQETKNSDVKMAVVALSGPGPLTGSFRKLGIPLYHLKLNTLWGFISFFFRLQKLTRLFRPSIIQGWMYHGNVVASLVQMLLVPKEVKVIWNVRCSMGGMQDYSIITKFVVHISRKLSTRAETIIYNSIVSARQHEIFGFDSDRTKYLPNGFDTEKFSPNEVLKRDTRQRFGICDGTYVLGVFARFHPIKGHHDFLEALAKIVEKHSNTVALMAGRNIDSSNTQLVSWVEKFGLGNHVMLLGPREDLNNLYPALDLYVQASLSEAFPNVIGEACSSAVPCVATDVGDSLKIVKDQLQVVPPNQPVTMANACCDILELNADVREQLGARNRAIIVEMFSIQKVALAYIELYSSTLSNTN